VSTESSPESEVTVVVNRKPACRIELEVKASPSLVSAARKDALKKVGKEVTLPGFRKGHAPIELILKKYPGAIESQWHKSIADAAFAAAQAQARVPMLNTNTPVTFDLKKHSLIEGAELSFSFDTEPEVPSVDPKLFELKPVETAEVGDKQVDEAIQQMRYFYADWKSVSDRPIQDGDYIMIDLDTLDEPPQNVFHHVRFEVSKARMANWMRNLVQGAKSGDVLEALSEPDAEASEQEKKEFTPKKVRLTILKVEEAILPEMDDFAKKMGVNDVPQMRESVRGALMRNAEEKSHSLKRDQINDFLISQYTFELPLSLIETEKNHRKNQLQSDPKFRYSYEKLPADEKKKIDEKIYTESDQAVRLFYLSRQIVRDAKIPVTHAEVQQEAIQSSRAFGQNVDPDHLSNEVFALALSKVILAKAQDYILSNCQKSEAPAAKG
jgi:trigger factor